MPTSDASTVSTPWLKWFILALVSLIGGYAVVLMYAKGESSFALLTLILVTAGVIIFARKETYAHRYIYPGMAAVVLFIIFPLLYTVSIAFTNYSGSNQLSYERVQQQFLQRTFADDRYQFKFQIYHTDNDKVLLFFSQADKKLISEPVALDQNLQQVSLQATDTPPTGNQAKLMVVTKNRNILSNLAVFTPDGTQLAMSGLRQFAAKTPLYTLAADGESLVNQQTNEQIKPNFDIGFYQAVNPTGEFVGKPMAPGFVVSAGWFNFERILTDEGIQGPFIKIFIWTVIFAGLTVVFTLAVGMVLASVVQWEGLKGKAVYRMLLILPYAVPAFISILIFKGLFNQSFGEINQVIEGLFGIRINWFTDPILAKTMILIVNTWLGYPYIMILCMGLLKSIPADLYEASAIDGANPIQNFFKITFPLMIKPLTPLLIASFAFNFNNFVLIQLLTNGAPDIIGSSTPAGHTDLLVSYTYRIAFEGGGGQDFGLASAIATLIFLMVGGLALLNLKASKNQLA
ncbi:maltose ABC transporter permease MalF [Motilimonas cestriensis]|uniref:Maltose/maltodextrin transport system permease protein n=1 Tax=Motilimonas cestriensis TaxID=2742685 RepID=A0ABS8WEM6_9GAMM|nr:maltose ABC transporter permease MalF [Motilimonas cestriensis]MCE2596148.1 maltose ABC transporter permease MalF [Motilimonas cestriensis]